jgi:hypothetical protein
MTFAKLLAAKEKRRLPNEMCCGRQPRGGQAERFGHAGRRRTRDREDRAAALLLSEVAHMEDLDGAGGFRSQHLERLPRVRSGHDRGERRPAGA